MALYVVCLGLVVVCLLATRTSVESPMTLKEEIKDAIQQGIVGPLRLPPSALMALYAQAVLETGNFTARYFPTTHSLFNRHKGSGRGEWTGQTYYVSVGDADLRIYTDVYQSARDMAQLLSDPLYGAAYLALRANNPEMYFEALQAAGFSTQATYALALKRTYEVVA